VERHFEKVVDALKKELLLSEEEAARLSKLHQLCAGKNLYYLQELARRDLPRGSDAPSEAVP
jgi:hypothetical protein